MNHQQTFDPEAAIRLAKTGDANSVAVLVEHYRPYLRLLAKMSIDAKYRSKIDESDIVQEASLFASRDMNQFRGETEPELAAWLRRVLMNVIANAHRHFSRDRRDIHLEQQLHNDLEQSSIGLARLAGRESTPSQHAIHRERAVVLAEALEKLPANYRQVLVLRELEGCSLAEVAEELGGTRNSVQKLWARAIREIRNILKEMP